jgi:archaemetzincin
MSPSRRQLLQAMALVAASGIAPTALAGEKRRVHIQPLGRALPDADVALVGQALSVFYQMDVKLLDRVPLPHSAYYPPRHRYRAEKLLEFLRTRGPDDAFRVLGLTGVDISTTKGKYKDWGIVGLATLDGRVGVLSSFRCKRRAKSAAHARIRLGKTAVHEMGHTLGLPHCPTRGCLMEDAKGTVLTIDREYDLCEDICRPKLRKAGYSLGSAADAPWPKPK